MKKVILLFLMLVGSFVSIGQINLSTTLRQDTIIKVLRQINSGSNSATSTLSSTIATSSGTISSGFQAVTFVTSSNFSGDINGVPRQPNFIYSFSAKQLNKLPAITYSINTGTLTIDKLQ